MVSGRRFTLLRAAVTDSSSLPTNPSVKYLEAGVIGGLEKQGSQKLVLVPSDRMHSHFVQEELHCSYEVTDPEDAAVTMGEQRSPKQFVIKRVDDTDPARMTILLPPNLECWALVSERGFEYSFQPLGKAPMDVFHVFSYHRRFERVTFMQNTQ